MLMTPDGRLTRQGRLVRTFTFVALVVAGVVVGSRAFAVGGEELGQAGRGEDPLVLQVDTYTVSPNETLWEIATSLRGEGEDTRDIVKEIMVLNGMDSVRLDAGQQILVPLSS